MVFLNVSVKFGGMGMGRGYETAFEVQLNDFKRSERVCPYLYALFDFLGIGLDDIKMEVERKSAIKVKFAVDEGRKEIFVKIAEGIPELNSTFKTEVSGKRCVHGPMFDVNMVKEKISSAISLLFEILNSLVHGEVDRRLIIKKLKLVNKRLEECEKEAYKFFDYHNQ